MQPDFAPALHKALTRAIPGLERLEGLVRLTGGASQETWAFDAMAAGARIPLILRRSPGGVPRVIEGTAVSLATEARTIEAARAKGARAPNVRLVLTPEDGIGEGYVMERLSGETIARKILRDAEFDAVRPHLAYQCGELLARIHQVDVAPLKEFLPVVDGPTQLRQFRDRYDSYDYPHPMFELAFKWLEPRLGRAARQTLVHGDFRHGN
ncbi:MAG TPA: phosphotransferase family protein, partial [Rhizomicrobium sp.]|nr:phosphotransferase family protein [Rhizomicrobium sp.]